MIDFYDSSIADILPDKLCADPEVQAIGYAISKQIQRLTILSLQTSLYSVISILDEDKLDLLAVELRTQYYGDFLSLDEKREIIKRTLLWYYRAGTLSTVKELTDFIFRNAKIEEWFDYEASPYLFRIMIKIIDQDISLDMYMRYLQSLKAVKNTRSHLEAIIYNYSISADVKSVAVGGVGNYIKVKGLVAEAIEDISAEEKSAALLRESQHIKIKGYENVEVNDVYILSDEGEKIKVWTDNSFVKVDV